MPADVSAVSLTDLCAICHVNPIRYTCPRDGIHTCSLSCVKRHKQWAQCSGVRDPAEYRKRAELATPSSIDKDFNFITKVERSLSRADDHVANRGINLAPARLRPHDTKPKLDIEAEARGIKIVRAPKGLSRSKQNKTHVVGTSRGIVWTLEWVYQDGQRLINAAPETRSIKALYDASVVGKKNSRKRKRPSDVGDEAHPKAILKDAPETQIQKSQGHDKTVPYSEPAAPSRTPMSIREQDLTQRVGEDCSESGAPTGPADVFFYLHRPNTESQFKCMIPIPSDTPLQEALTNKTLLEFPTIYVRNEPPDRLQPPFILEDEYIRRHGSDIPINVTVPEEKIPDEEDLEEGELSGLSETGSNLDETRVLEVLAQDLGS